MSSTNVSPLATTQDAAHLNSLPPPGKLNNEELLVFLRSRAYLSSPLYGSDFSRFRKSELYDQSDQWLQRSHGTRDSQYPAQWKKIEYASNDPNAIPLPVHNEGVLLRENESARLGRPEYKPRVRPSGSNPDITAKDGAKGAERALQDRLKHMWADEEDKLYLHMPLYGGAWLKSSWDQTWMETVRVPAPSLCCPRHPKSGQPPMPVQSQPEVEMEGGIEDAAEGGVEEQGIEPGGMPVPDSLTPPDLGSDLGSDLPPIPGAINIPAEGPGAPPPPQCDYCVKKEETDGSGEGGPGQPPPSCPSCPDHPPLVPYSPTLDEALNSDLGTDIPRGDWFLKVVYPYQIFVRDAGVGLDPTDIDEWVETRTEPLAWAEERWPDKIRDKENGELRVHPQNAATLMAENPTLGSPDILQYAQHAGVFRSHVVVYEYHRKPWLEWSTEQRKYTKNRGRSVVAIVGLGGVGVVCLDSHFSIESLNKPGTFVPRVHLQFIPWEKRDGGRRSTVGQSLWDRLFDVQDGINERMSQVRAVNQRGALPWYLQRSGINLETRSADAAVPFRRVIADIDPQDRQPPLQLLNNVTIDAGVYEEISYYTTFMGKHVVEVEKGQVPPGVAAATAIAYLKTESGEKRRPRILRIRRSLTRAWDHGLQLMSALYIEDRPYQYEDEEDNEDRSAFINGDVIAQSNPKVDIYPTPDYDITDARRESIRDQVQLGILNPQQTPQLARKISSAMDESLEFFLDDDLQEQQAQREWRDFKEKEVVPVVDPSLDDDLTHYQEHGRACFSEWFREREKEAQWDEALSIIGGDWDQGLENVKMMLVMPMPPPPGLPPGVAPPPLPSIQSLIERQWSLKIQQSIQMAQMAAAERQQQPVMPGVPQPPPPPSPLPAQRSPPQDRHPLACPHGGAQAQGRGHADEGADEAGEPRAEAGDGECADLGSGEGSRTGRGWRRSEPACYDRCAPAGSPASTPLSARGVGEGDLSCPGARSSAASSKPSNTG